MIRKHSIGALIALTPVIGFAQQTTDTDRTNVSLTGSVLATQTTLVLTGSDEIEVGFLFCRNADRLVEQADRVLMRLLAVMWNSASMTKRALTPRFSVTSTPF